VTKGKCYQRVPDPTEEEIRQRCAEVKKKHLEEKKRTRYVKWRVREVSVVNTSFLSSDVKDALDRDSNE